MKYLNFSFFADIESGFKGLASVTYSQNSLTSTFIFVDRVLFYKKINEYDI